MKKVFGALSTFLTLVLFTSLQFSTSSCTKEVEVIVKDTVEIEVEVEVPKAPIDTLAVLTAKQYHMEEIRILQNNNVYYYKKGNAGNTASFDQEYIKFNTDKTGTYFYNGTTNTINWDFIGINKTKIRYTLNRSTPVTINWENISYSGDSLSYSEYYLNNGVNSMSTAVRIAQ